MKLANPLIINRMRMANAGTVISSKLKERLMNAGVSGIYVVDELSSDVEIHDLIEHNTFENMILNIHNVYAGTIEKKYDIKAEIEQGTKYLSEVVEKLINTDFEQIMYDVHQSRSEKDWLFQHAANVSILCLLMGRELGYTAEQLVSLGGAGVLHDIGLYHEVKVNNGSYTDKNMAIAIEKHCEVAREIIRTLIPMTSANVTTAVLMHHERMDGSGFPNKYQSEKIIPFARILAICDAFDMYTACGKFMDPIEKKGSSVSEIAKAKEDFGLIPPAERTAFDGINYLYKLATEGKLDFDMVKTFSHVVMPYTLGSGVKLTGDNSLGENAIGMVIRNSKGLPERPIVKVLSGNLKSEYLDLANDNRYRNVTIESTVEI